MAEVKYAAIIRDSLVPHDYPEETVEFDQLVPFSNLAEMSEYVKAQENKAYPEKYYLISYTILNVNKQIVITGGEEGLDEVVAISV